MNKKIRSSILRLKTHVGSRRKLLFHILAAVIYLAVTFYYMTPQFTQCTTTVYGFGDNTAGPIWRGSLDEDLPPLGGYEDSTNYPKGENLYTPVAYSLSLQSAVVWGTEKIAGPVCGYNIVNIIGFVFTALAMYGFIFWLTKRRAIALLAGYIVSFAPYFQYKVGGHPGYGYAGILVLILWFGLKLFKGRRTRDAVALGVAVAACFYWDPYFSLLSMSLVIPLALSWLMYWLFKHKLTMKSFVEEFKKLFVSGIVAVLLITPLLGIRVVYSNQINNYVSGSRGDVMYDATFCSILPWDYLLPADSNYFAEKVAGDVYSTHIKKLRHKCNPSEYTTGISAVVLAVTTLGLVVIAWELVNKRRLLKNKDEEAFLKYVLFAAIVVVLFSAALALPPKVGPLHFPSFVLLKLTSTWRILAREYLIVNIAITTLFSIVLYVFSQHRLVTRSRLKYFIWLSFLLGVFVQYQVFKPFTGSGVTFDYNRDLPKTFYWLRDQKDIKVLAAYPMDKVGESENLSSFLTGQKVHQKALLNSALPSSPEEPLRFSLKDLTDPQTLPVLRGLGIRYLEIHTLNLQQLNSISGLKVLHYEDFKNPIMGGYIAIAEILPGTSSTTAVVLENGYPTNAEIMKSPIELEYETSQRATLKLLTTGHEAGKESGELCMDIKMADSADRDMFKLRSSQGVIFTAVLNGEYQTIRVVAPTNQTVYLENNSGHNMRINNLGCQSR